MGFLGSLGFRLGIAAAAALVIAILWFRGNAFKADAQRSAAALDQAIDINESNATIFANYQKQVVRLQTLVAEGAKKKAVIREKHDERKKEIYNAPTEDDGPLAPVLRDTLDSLRKPEGFGPDRGDGAATTTS